MPASAAIHAVVFTAGALIGGGITAAVVNRQQRPILPHHVPPPPAMDVITTGQPGALGVLKYGNPGARKLLRVTARLPTLLQVQFQIHSSAMHMSPRMIGGSGIRLG